MIVKPTPSIIHHFSTIEDPRVNRQKKHQLQDICFRCHFLVHARFKVPNKWLRYLNRVASGKLQPPLPHDWRAGNEMLKQGDIEEVYPWVETPNGYLSGLPLQAYSGPMKIVTVIIDGEEVPDPRIYVQHPKKGLIERKYTEGVANARIELSKYLELKLPYVGDT